MKHSYVVTAALLGVLFPMNYVVYLILTQGYAHLIEPNPIIIWGEAAGMVFLTLITVYKLLREIKMEIKRK